MRLRYFTPTEANALLPRLAEELHELRAISRKIQDLNELVDPESERHLLVEANRATAFMRLAQLQRQFLAQREVLDQLGVTLVDLGRGRIDFPALKEGQPALLCWRMGEPHLMFWRPQDSEPEERKSLTTLPQGVWEWYS